MNQVRTWLKAIGLAQYADVFEANDIEMDLLGQLDDQMLKDIYSATIRMRTRIASSVDVPRRGCHCLARMFPVISSECSQKNQLVDPLGR